MDFWNWFIQTFSSDKPPWWGVPVLTGLAVLFGAVIAYLSTRASDRRKAKNEDRRRWSDDIKSRTSEFLIAADAVKHYKENKIFYGPEEAEKYLQDLKALWDSLHHLELIAPERLWEIASDFAQWTAILPPHSHSAKLNKQYRSLRNELLNEFRRSIGIEKPKRSVRIAKWIQYRVYQVLDLRLKRSEEGNIRNQSTEQNEEEHPDDAPPSNQT